MYSFKVVVLGQSCSIWAKEVVFEEIRCIWAKLVAFEQVGYSGKLFVFGK